MKKRKVPFNIHDLNFILTFAGFAIFTSITDTIPSVVYRAFALVVALLCIAYQKFKLPKLPIALKVLLLFVVILDIKISLHLLLDSSIVFKESRNLALLFIYGITLIPVLAFVFGYKRINWRTTLVVLELLLFFTILRGYMMSLDVVEEGRMSLNVRQSTLAFGDNSGYLFLLSICLLNYSAAMVTEKSKLLLWRVFLVTAMVISIFGLARAGSRGPFVATVMAFLFVIVTLKIKKQVSVLLFFVIFVGVFEITNKTLEQFAPVLFARMTNTIEEGDTSGRDVLFEQAIQKMEESPIMGGNPIILGRDSMTSYHNGFLDVGVCLGYAGFFFYICFSLWMVYTIFTNRHLIKSLSVLFLSGMYFFSVTRTMSGAGLVMNPNFLLSVVCACIISVNIKKRYYENNRFTHFS